MSKANALVSALLVSFIAGCAEQQPVQAIDLPAISAVQAEIKRQVAVYLAAAQNPPTVKIEGVDTPISRLKPSDWWCGSGKIDFDISSIKAELTTTLDNNAGATASFTVPVNLVTLGPSGSHTTDETSTQLLTYNLWPTRLQNPAVVARTPSQSEIDAAPIAKVLLSLRDALVLSAMKVDYSGPKPKARPPQACFSDYNPDKPSTDAGNSYKLGLSITNDTKAGLSVKVAILSFSATGESKSTTGNTLTVSFVQQGIRKIQAAKDEVDQACKKPIHDAKACTDAKAKLAALEGEGIGEALYDMTQ